MSNGINALKGFDYQATVILDRLFDHFDHNGPSARARPEGADDLDLSWIENAVEHRRYEQIKKPREDNQGNRTPGAWTLSDACDELLPNTITNLSGNAYEQVWIVGDEVTEEVRALLGSQSDASFINAYARALHLLARGKAIDISGLDNPLRRQLLRWQPPANLSADLAGVLPAITQSFTEQVKTIGAPDDVANRYRAKATELNAGLPGILARTKILPLYGTEQQVVKRVYDRLEQRYGLQRSIVENTLFRNLRGFINDISKQPGRRFHQAELDFELRAVWPHMIPVKSPPSLDHDHVARPDLADRFTTRWTGTAIEAIGISASGKTMLAAEIAAKAETTDPDRDVYYAEVTTGDSLRDVLVGVAYHLRRMNFDGPFVLSVDASLTGEELLTRLARSFSALPRPLLLLVDLVQGTCDAAFARDLATFVRALSSPGLRIAVFGQESVLRELSAAERERHGLSHVDVRGFRFEEFVSLVKASHPDPDRAVLWDVYNRVTAGREAGLFAGLARALAAAPSLQQMSELAARPAEDVLAAAEQQRFARVSSGARRGAEKLVCFALPFRRKDAEAIFPDDNIGAAIRELLALGLLRTQDDDLFEMHETVRAGLEGMIALNVRNAAHEALATWYNGKGVITPEILHLEKAGRPADARVRARDAFLRGQNWRELAAYVTEHRLVTPREIISVMTDVSNVSDKYLFSNLLLRLGQPVDAKGLFDAVRRQRVRIATDYQWALAVFEAMLESDPTLLDALIRFTLETSSEKRLQESALSSLMLAARRKHARIGPLTIDFFKAAAAETKRSLLPFMLATRSRDALQPALEFIASESQYVDFLKGGPPTLGVSLQIDRIEDAIEFLASMPDVQLHEMAASRSALLGPLDGLVWPRRRELAAHCVRILKDATEQEKILESAIRVLAFLGEPTLCVLCEPLLSRTDRGGRAAKIVPILVPALCDRDRYEAQVLDTKLRLEDRAAALSVLAAVGTDLGRTYRLVGAQKDRDVNAQDLDFVFLVACAQSPFANALPVIEEFMKSTDDRTAPIVLAALTRMSELPGHEITALCVRALAHQNPQIRLGAAIALTRRRSSAALGSLIAQYAKEDNEALVVPLASAIAASGPRSAADLQSVRHDPFGIRLWQCIVATRLRDHAMADRLVQLATDASLNWQLRRAAIFAAGRIQYEAALERIIPVVMRERSPLTMDGSQNLRCHELLANILVFDVPGLMSIFAQGKAGFVAFFADCFEQSWRASTSREGLPPAADLAGWLFDRLSHHGWPNKADAVDRILNELHVPILQSAIFRALRLLGRADLIENQLPHADYVWLAMKCLMERLRAGNRDLELKARLKGLVDASACKGNALLYRVIDQIAVPDAAVPASTPSPLKNPGVPAPDTLRLKYAEAVQALSGANPNFKPPMPPVLDPLTKEQLERLILLAEPANDRHTSTETFVPLVSFTPNSYVVAQRRVTSTGAETIGALLRPVIAAANRFGVSIPWHQELLSGVFANAYAPKFLAALGAQDDAARFYEALTEQADLLLPRLCIEAQAAPVSKYIDVRIVPFLQRYISSGTDEFFEGLCILARHVNSPEIDPVLSGLLHR